MVDLNTIRLGDYDRCALDTETDGIDTMRSKPFALAVSLPDGRDFCVDLRDQTQFQWAQDQVPQARETVFANLKFDAHMLANVGIHFDLTRAHDVITYAALLNENLLQYNLDALGHHFIKQGKDTDIYPELAALFGGKPTKSAQAPNLHRAPWDRLAHYACMDTRLTLNLLDYEMPELERQGLEVVRKLEQDLAPVLWRMERRGVRVDLARAEALVPEVTVEVDKLQKELDAYAGYPVNIQGGSKSLMSFLDPRWQDGRWVLRDGTVALPTPKGKPSLDAECLQRMTDPWSKHILQMRLLTKMRDMFLLGHVIGSQFHGRVHTTFNSTKTDSDGDTYGTISGRLSSNHPNLQNITKRNPFIASRVRSLFLPEEGEVWMTCDWSQADQRVLMSYMGDKTLIRKYHENPDLDFHTVVAEMTGLPRDAKPGIKGNAKAINLGVSFGMSPGRMAKEMGLPYTSEIKNDREYLSPGAEAEAIFTQYHRMFPMLKPMLQCMTQVARERGYVRTVTGRRCRFPGGKGTHKAGPLIFQGGCAESLKSKMVEVDALYEAGLPGTLLLNVHDELGSSVRIEDMARVAPEVIKSLTTFDGVNSLVKWAVPWRSEATYGPNWWEASKKGAPVWQTC